MVTIKKIIKTLIIALAMLTPVFANQYHAGDDNVSSNWLKPLNDYLFNEGVAELNKDTNPPEWIQTINGPRLEYLHNGESFDNPFKADLIPSDVIELYGRKYMVLEVVGSTRFTNNAKESSYQFIGGDEFCSSSPEL